MSCFNCELTSGRNRVRIRSTQLRNGDFPAVCAMTGAPAETWHRFRFSTLPGWVYALLLLVLTCFGAIPALIVMAAVSRPASGRMPLTLASERRIRLATWLPVGVVGAGVLFGVDSLLVYASAASIFAVRAPSTVVYTKWLKDGNVIGGAQNGYRPQLTGLTGREIVRAAADRSRDGDSWVVDITFSPRGRRLFAELTRENVAACPGDPDTNPAARCPERYLGLWMGLSQKDVDSWEEPGYANLVSRRWVAGSTADPRPKLLSDPITIQEVTGGSVELSGSFTQQDAQQLARAVSKANANNATYLRLASVLSIVGAFLFLVGVLSLFVARIFTGPTAKVLPRAGGEYDNAIELRRVHPAFVEAVERQLAGLRDG